MKILPILMFFFFLNQNSDNNFYDSCGNKIVIENLETFPKSIDLSFFENNFSSELIEKEYCEKKYKFEIRIIGVKKMSKNKYDVRVYAIPKSDEPIEMKEKIRYMGYSHYLMKTQKIDKKFRIENIKWIYGEI
jgi:hypothetical protein